MARLSVEKEPRDVALSRLSRQGIASPRFRKPEEVVSSLGAVQAQSFLGGLWAIGLRIPDSTESLVERAIADRTIVRTWPMRGTLHFVAASDVRWMLDLLGSRTIARTSGRMRQFGIDGTVISRSRAVLTDALSDGRQLSRPEIYAALERAGVSSKDQRGLQILWRLAHDGFLCLGERRGKQPTFVLLDEWIPKGRPLGRQKSLETLSRTYFIGHGPATVHDFSWWSGLTMSESREGLEMVSHELVKQVIDGNTYWMSPDVLDASSSTDGHLLPEFDEFLVGYKDRRAALDSPSRGNRPGPSSILNPVVVLGGRVAGMWRRVLKKDRVVLSVDPFASLSPTEKAALERGAGRYGRFLGLPVDFVARSPVSAGRLTDLVR
jgi:hypothetical protein